jgi:hypothetical protein
VLRESAHDGGLDPELVALFLELLVTNGPSQLLASYHAEALSGPVSTPGLVPV